MSSGVLTPINPTPTPTDATNPQVTVTGAPPAAPEQSPAPAPSANEPMVPMIFSDGKPYRIPQSQVHNAVKDGNHVAMPMIDPSSGSKYYIPLSGVNDAVKDGWHIDDPAVNALAETNVVTGAVKRGVDTMRGIADLAGGQGAAEKLGIPDVNTQRSGIAEKIGAGAEAVLEFMLGDNALEGLSLGEKLEKVAPVIKNLESHPALAKLVSGAVRGAATGGAQGAVAGAPSGQAAEEALKGAGFGAAGGAVAAVPEATSAGRAASAVAAPATSVEQPGIVQGLLKGRDVEQPMAQAALRRNPWAYARTGSRIATSLERPIDMVMSDAKKNYRAIDQAAGTDIEALYKKLENTEYQIRQLTDTEEDQAKEAAYEKSRQGIIDKIDDAKSMIEQKLGPKGLSLFDKAKGLYTRASALQDLETKVFKNPSIVQGDPTAGTPETIDVDAAIKAIQRLDYNTKYGASRLEQALGKNGADLMKNDLFAAQRAGQKAIAARSLIKKIGLGLGITGGIASGAAEGYHILTRP